MKKCYLCLILILSLLFLGNIAQASDISQARRIGTLAITNNGTATSGVSTNFTLSSPGLITTGDANSTLTNVAIQYNNADVAFMPGYGTNPWVVWVDSIGSGQTLNYSLYTAESTGGKICYFPDSTGMTITDNSSMNLNNNFTIELKAYIDTTFGLARDIVSKPNAFITFIEGTGIITSGIVTDNQTLTSGDDYSPTPSGVIWHAQTFTTSGGGITNGIVLKLGKVGNPGTITVSIRATSDGKPTGSDIGYGYLPSSEITGTDLYYVPIIAATLAASTQYAIVVRAPSGDGSNYLIWRADQTSPPYSGGSYVESPDSGITWNSPQTGCDFLFDIGMAGKTVSVNGINSSKMIPKTSANTTTMILSVTDYSGNHLGNSPQPVNLNGASVPSNSYPYTIGRNNVMPYMDYFSENVSGSNKCYLSWQYGTTFTDQSGNGNHGIPSFRTTSSDADVSASLTSFKPTTEAELTTWTLGKSAAILTSTANFSTKMYSEGDYSRIPGADVANALLDTSGTPRTLWWFPFLFGAIAIISFMIYGLTQGKQQTGPGSLLVMAVVIEALLIALGALNPIPIWPAYLFPVAATAIVLSQKHYGWGANLQENFMPFLMLSWVISVMICVILEGSDLGRSLGGGWNMAGIISNLSQVQGLSIASLVAIGSFVLDFIRTVFRVLLWDYSFYTGDYMIIRWIFLAVFSPAIVWGIAKVFTPIFANFLRIF